MEADVVAADAPAGELLELLVPGIALFVAMEFVAGLVLEALVPVAATVDGPPDDVAPDPTFGGAGIF